MAKIFLLLFYVFISLVTFAQPRLRFSSEALSVTANGNFAAVSTSDSFFIYRLPELQLYKKMKHNLAYPTLLGFAASAFEKPDLNDVLIVQENNFKPTNPALGISLWAQLERYQKDAFGQRVKDSVGLWSISQSSFINNKVPGNVYFDYFTFREMGVFGMNYISNAFAGADGDSVFTTRASTLYSRWDTDKSKQTEFNKIIKRIITCPVNLSFTVITQDAATKKYKVLVKNVQTHQDIYTSAEFDELPLHFSYTPNGERITFSVSPSYDKTIIYIADVKSKTNLATINVNEAIKNLQFVNYDSAVGYSTASNWVQWNIADARIEKQISGTSFFSGFQLLNALSLDDHYLLVHTQAMSAQGNALMQSELQLSVTGDFDVFAAVQKGGEETIALQDGFNMQLNDLPDTFFDMIFNKSKTHFTILGNNDRRLQVWETRSRKKIMDKYFENPVQGFIDESGRYVWVIEYKYGQAERYRLRHIDLKTGKMISSDQLVASEGAFKNNSKKVSVRSIPGETNAWYASDGDNIIWKFKGFDLNPEKYVFTMPGFLDLRNIGVDKNGLVYANVYTDKQELALLSIDFKQKSFKKIIEGNTGSSLLYKDGLLLEGENGLLFYKNGNNVCENCNIIDDTDIFSFIQPEINDDKEQIIDPKIAYQMLENSAEKQQKLLKLISIFKNSLQKEHSKFLIESNSAIQSVLVPGNANAKKLSEYLQKNGFDVRAILSPTVAAGKERLRICLHAYNTEEEVLNLSSAINN
ncbi:MAG: pyridoxal phosphate-dependent aminotransferase family protein, partial [Sphingobacteriales bacterium]